MATTPLLGAAGAERARERAHAALDEEDVEPHPAYDTLDDVDWIDDVNNLKTFFERLFEAPLQQAHIVGELLTGGLCLESSFAGEWGSRSLQFAGHSERWYVRSEPRGRIGQPLREGEVRRVAIMICESASSAQVTSMRLRLLPPVPSLIKEMAMGVEEPRDLYDRMSHAAEAVNMFPINVFEHRSPRFESDNMSYYRSILGQYADITDKHKVRSGFSEFAVAGCLAGVCLPDCTSGETIRRTFNTTQYCSIKKNLSTRFIARMSDKLIGSNDEKQLLVMRYIYAAEAICDAHTYTNVLDMLADSFYYGALPDDMRSPDKVLLVMAAAVRVAGYPDRYNIAPGTLNDIFSTHEFNVLIEAVQPSLASFSVQTPCKGKIMAIDVLVYHTRELVNRHLAELAPGSAKREQLEKRIEDNLAVLYRIGVGLCIDVCGPPPPEDDAAMRTRYGSATRCVDPVCRERDRATWAADRSMGRLRRVQPSVRATSRNARQLALLRVVAEVERALMTTVVAAAAQPRPQPQPESPPESPPPPPTTATTASAASAAATAGPPSSSKKAKGKARRAAKAAGKAGKAGKADKPANAPRPATGLEASLDEAALKSKATYLAEALELGLCAGSTHLFKQQAFLVHAGAVQRCATCIRTVHVIEAVALGGRFKQCTTCGQPRCSVCVQREIDKLGPVSDDDDDSVEEEERQCFCCGQISTA